MSNVKIISLAKFLEHKTRKDNCDYDYTVTAGGKTGLQLNVYRMNDERTLLFSGAMTPEKTIRSGDIFYVTSQNATYTLEFFM